MENSAICEDRCRRRTDRKQLAQLTHSILYGDISMLCLVGGFGLIVWAVFGLLIDSAGLEAYAKTSEIGGVYFWAFNYLLCGLALWWVASKQFPPLASLLVGSWICVLWTWLSLARILALSGYPTGNATSIVYILIGLLVIHRSARR